MFSEEEYQRYQKHLLLAPFGLSGQEKLKNASVLVVGAGGLGCPVLLYLSAAGVGHLGVIDPDVVDITNLQRQVLYTTADIGQPKAETATSRLKALNPTLQFTHYDTEKLHGENAEGIIINYDLVIDCTDNFTVRYIINDACVALNKPFVYGAIHQFEGQISVFNYQNGPTYRCLFPEKPSDFEIPNCAAVGVLGILPGVIGTMQATEAIKVLTGIGKVLSGTLLMIDLLENSHRKIKFKRKPEHVSVSKPEQAQANLPKSIAEITTEELAQMLEDKPNLILIDVREPQEFAICALPNAQLIPLASIPQMFERIPQHQPVVVYCHHGVRSKTAIDYLQKHKKGFENLINLQGGIHAWAMAIDPTMAVY